MKDNRYKVYEDFQKEFPIETLSGLPLEQYTNLKRSDSFCYWVESKTYCLGSIWGGTSYKFGIYEYNKKPVQLLQKTTDMPGTINIMQQQGMPHTKSYWIVLFVLQKLQGMEILKK